MYHRNVVSSPGGILSTEPEFDCFCKIYIFQFATISLEEVVL